MPQMFPTPFMLLMTMVSIVFLLVIIRVFWGEAAGHSPTLYKTSTSKGSSSYFTQPW